jgi:hypothetical protein
MNLRRALCAVTVLCSVVGSIHAATKADVPAPATVSVEEVAPGVLVRESGGVASSMIFLDQVISSREVLKGSSSAMVVEVVRGVELSSEGKESGVLVVQTLLANGDKVRRITPDFLQPDFVGPLSPAQCEAACSRDWNQTSDALQAQMDAAVDRYTRDKAACNGNQACIDAVTATFVSVADAIIASQDAANAQFGACLAGCRGGSAAY